MFKWFKKKKGDEAQKLSLKIHSVVRDVFPGITRIAFDTQYFWGRQNDYFLADFQNPSPSEPAFQLAKGQRVTIWFSFDRSTMRWTTIHRIKPFTILDKLLRPSRCEFGDSNVVLAPRITRGRKNSNYLSVIGRTKIPRRKVKMFDWLKRNKTIGFPRRLQVHLYIRDAEPGITEMGYSECEQWSIPGNKKVARFQNLSRRDAEILEEGEDVTVWYSPIPHTGYWKIHRVVENAIDGDRDSSERG